MSKLNSTVSKISASGWNVILVPRFFVVPVDFEVGLRLAALVLLLEDLAVAPDFEVEPLRQRIDDRDADAVQAARHFVAVVVELAAGVQHREHDFGGRPAARDADRSGMPRPLSTTVTEPSMWIVTLTWSQKPASASSIELSTTS